MYYINYEYHEPLQHRVVRSAYLLDSRRPGWAKEIDLLQFKKGKGILDQLWGGHEEGQKELGFVEAEHGFKTRYMHETPEDLQEHWEFQVLWRLPSTFKINPWEV